MIVVSVGSSDIPFDRLLRAVDELRPNGDVVVQHGPSAIRPRGARCVDHLPFDELAALMRDARVVVTHAGVGSILLALTNGKKPVVVPRQKAFGETVDDHQVECARRFAREELVTVVADLSALGAAVGASGNGSGRPRPNGEVPLVQELRTYIRAAVETGSST